MKKTKRIVALLVVSVMMVAALFAVTACDPEEKYDGGTYDIKVWVSEVAGVKEQFAEQIKKFNETNAYGYTFNATVEGISESESATSMITDIASGADLYCFAQDQTARLVQAGALAQPGKAATQEITNNNDADSLRAVTVGGKVRAYPLTSDNGYFMIYDKSVVKQESLGDLAKIVKDCEDAGKNFSMEVSTSAWYTASFFFATGCHSDWQINENGKPTGISDDFNSAAGIIAMKGMQILTKSSCYNSSSAASDFSAAIPSAVVITGTWGVNTAKEALGDNFGVAELPSFTVDGETYHMGSYKGNKLMGVRPTNDPNKAAGLSLLARYLTNEENQLARHESFGWGPSNVAAQNSDAVKTDAVLQALSAQNVHATPQGVIDGSWWDIAKLLGAATADADLGDTAAFQTALTAYDAQIAEEIAKDPEALRRFAVIGAIGGTNWDTDLEMVEEPENTWTTVNAYEITADTQFKIRQGGKWDVQFGAGNSMNGDNITLESLGVEAGTYKIKLVATVNANGEVTGGVVSLIPAE